MDNNNNIKHKFRKLRFCTEHANYPQDGWLLIIVNKSRKSEL